MDKYYIPTEQEILECVINGGTLYGTIVDSEEIIELRIGNKADDLLNFIKINDCRYSEKEEEIEYSITPEIYRLKYLDKEDLESLGFEQNVEGEIPSFFSFYKIRKNIVYQITVYYDFTGLERCNLIRIFEGTLHNFPYSEIFRGDIKNKFELKTLLKQLGINESTKS